MNYNELVQEAENKISNKEYELAAQMFHDIAAQTGDIYCTKKALDPVYAVGGSRFRSYG